VFELRIAPAQSLDYTGVAYQFPGGFNCSESSPFQHAQRRRILARARQRSDSRLAHDVELRARRSVQLRHRCGINVLYSGQSRSAVPTRSSSTAASPATRTAAAARRSPASDELHGVGAARRQSSARGDVEHPDGWLETRSTTRARCCFFALDDSGATPVVTPADPFFALTSDRIPSRSPISAAAAWR